jgi:hypothetical protein
MKNSCTGKRITSRPTLRFRSERSSQISRPVGIWGTILCQALSKSSEIFDDALYPGGHFVRMIWWTGYNTR